VANPLQFTNVHEICYECCNLAKVMVGYNTMLEYMNTNTMTMKKWDRKKNF
jgi:hypothetical protein